MGSATYQAAYHHQLIDRQRRFWPGDGCAAALSWGWVENPRAFASYAVENLGWIDVKRRGDGLVINCRPRIVDDAVLTELLLIIFRSEWRVISLNVLAEKWQYTVLQRSEDTLTVLSSLIGAARIAKLTGVPRLLNRTIPPGHSPLLPALRSVLGDSSAGTLEAFTRRLDKAFFGRWSLSRLDRDSGRMILDHLGQGFTPFNPSWSMHARDPRPKSLENYADPQYAAWVASTRKQAEDSQREIFDQVDALVDFPNYGAARLRYCRVTSPVALADGSRFILSAAKTDTSINLRNAS